MAQLRLLERLATMDLEQSGQLNTRTQITINQSITDFLDKLLNTKAASSEIDTEFGLVGEDTQVIGTKIPDPELIAKKMLFQISQYEKRLKRPTVDVILNDKDSIGVRFVIKGEIAELSGSSDFSVQGNILANGVLQFDTAS
jgi:predicted component of type VI protein secretion system